jgi:hypothetical protein
VVRPPTAVESRQADLSFDENIPQGNVLFHEGFNADG